MKHLLLLILLLPITIISQENFKIEDRTLIWQKVFEYKKNTKELETYLLKHGKFSDISVGEKDLVCNLINFTIDYKSQGLKRLSTDFLVSTHTIKAKVIIDLKKDRYRITLKNIEVAWNSASNTLYGEPGIFSPIEEYALKKNNTIFRKRFQKSISPYYNHDFVKIFSFKQKLSTSEEW